MCSNVSMTRVLLSHVSWHDRGEWLKPFRGVFSANKMCFYLINVWYSLISISHKRIVVPHQNRPIKVKSKQHKDNGAGTETEQAYQSSWHQQGVTCFYSTARWNASWCLSGTDWHPSKSDGYYLWGSVRVWSRWIVVGGGLHQEGPGEGLATPYDAQFHWDLAPSRAISSPHATPLPSDGLQQTNGHYHEPLGSRWMYLMQY